jgi:hypothetical protein
MWQNSKRTLYSLFRVLMRQTNLSATATALHLHCSKTISILCLAFRFVASIACHLFVVRPIAPSLCFNYRKRKTIIIMAGMTDTMPTLGMRLDAMIAQMDNLSSTQLYGIIVAATVCLCVVLLGTGHSSNLDLQHNNNDSNKYDLLKKPTVSKGRQPRWHIFKWINYLAVAAFLWSVCTFCLNASQYLHHESQGVLVQFLLGWSVFLMYFFGFFGVSFIHDDISKEDEAAAAVTSVGPKYVLRLLFSSLVE